jgi:hypothetical protein
LRVSKRWRNFWPTYRKKRNAHVSKATSVGGLFLFDFDFIASAVSDLKSQVLACFDRPAPPRLSGRPLSVRYCPVSGVDKARILSRLGASTALLVLACFDPLSGLI